MASELRDLGDIAQLVAPSVPAITSTLNASRVGSLPVRFFHGTDSFSYCAWDWLAHRILIDYAPEKTEALQFDTYMVEQLALSASVTPTEIRLATHELVSEIRPSAHDRLRSDYFRAHARFGIEHARRFVGTDEDGRAALNSRLHDGLISVEPANPPDVVVQDAVCHVRFEDRNEVITLAGAIVVQLGLHEFRFVGHTIPDSPLGYAHEYSSAVSIFRSASRDPAAMGDHTAKTIERIMAYEDVVEPITVAFTFRDPTSGSVITYPSSGALQIGFTAVPVISDGAFVTVEVSDFISASANLTSRPKYLDWIMRQSIRGGKQIAPQDLREVVVEHYPSAVLHPSSVFTILARSVLPFIVKVLTSIAAGSANSEEFGQRPYVIVNLEGYPFGCPMFKASTFTRLICLRRHLYFRNALSVKSGDTRYSDLFFPNLLVYWIYLYIVTLEAFPWIKVLRVEDESDLDRIERESAANSRLRGVTSVCDSKDQEHSLVHVLIEMAKGTDFDASRLPGLNEPVPFYPSLD